MKILILNPPYHLAIIREGRCQSPQNMRKNCIPQMTLAYIGGMLKKKGHEPKVIDCIASDMSAAGVFAVAEQFQPEVVLVNTTTPSINSDSEFIKSFKEKFSACFTVAFGTHVTACHEDIMSKFPFIDCVIRHEPEWTAMALVESLAAGRLDGGVAGCTMRIKGNVVVCPEREFNEDLDSLGYPAWEYFDESKYTHPVYNKPYLMVNTSRGCGHSCIFCVASLFYGKKVRYRSVESILDEIEHHVIGKFGVRLIWMYADDFKRSPEFVKKLCRRIIERKLKIVWWTNTRVDRIDMEMFGLMKKAGCCMLSIGGESGNAGILKNIKKGTKPEFIENTVKALRKTVINSLVYFLIGLPGETRETIRETLDFCKKINPDYVEFYPATPYPGTEFYEIAVKQQLIVNDNWDNFMCGGNEFVIEIPGIRKDELDKILRNNYSEYYFRFRYFLIFMKRVGHPSEFLRLLLFGLGYFKRFFVESLSKKG